MRHIGLIILFTFYASFSFAQKMVNGSVLLFNSKHKTGQQVFVSDVEIDGACCTTHSYSDANGYYQLIFRNLTGEAKVIAIKKGMRVINEQDLRFVPVEGKENRLNIYVFDNGEWTKEIKRISTALKKNISRRYDSLLNGLRAENSGWKTLLQEISQQFHVPVTTIAQAKNMVQSHFMEDLYYADKQAEDYARINLDSATASVIHAYEAFLKGDSREVLNLTAHLDVQKDLDDIARYRELKTIPYVLRARAAMMEWQYDVADTAYRKALTIDSLNPDVLTEYAALLQMRTEATEAIFRDYDKCLPLYEKAIPLFEQSIDRYPVTYAPNYARALHNAAIIYAQDYANTEIRYKAEAWLERSLAIIQQLAKDDPAIYNWKLGRTWSSIGRFYKEKAAFRDGDEDAIEKSDTAYTHAVEIYKLLAGTDPLKYLPEWANALEDKGYLYADVAKNQAKASRWFREALQVRELLSGKGPANTQTAHLYGIKSLAESYMEDDKFSESFGLFHQYLPVAENRLIRAVRKSEKDSLTEILVSFRTNIVLSALHAGKFREAEIRARKITGTYVRWARRHIAAALLLQGKFKEAETIFKEVVVNPEEKQWTLELFSALEQSNSIPRNRENDLARVRELMRE